MGFDINTALTNFNLIGVSHLRTPVHIRELFSLDTETQRNLLQDAKSLGIDSLVILSTCNRTELYANTDNHDLIKRLLVKYSKGSGKQFEEYGYHKQGNKAVNHLYRVAVGLDSQILGDFQIVGQLKDAYRKSENIGLIDTFMNRLFASCFQSSKKVKNETELSNGAASVSHAAVQFIKKNCSNLNNAKLLLYGTGEIGKDTCDNLIRHMQNRNLTLINRSEEKAETLASKYKVAYRPQEALKNEISEADVIIIATGASEPTVTIKDVAESKTPKLFLDLSVPRNIVPDVALLPNVRLIGVDELSQVSEEVLNARKQQIPMAEAIIHDSRKEFYEWTEMKYLSPIFERVKQGLNMLKEQEMEYHRGKLSEEEYKKADLIATNIINRVSKMSILHIKEVFKTDTGAVNILEKMFGGKTTHPHAMTGHPHAKKKQLK